VQDEAAAAGLAEPAAGGDLMGAAAAGRKLAPRRLRL
jgi:hypothetical protein